MNDLKLRRPVAPADFLDWRAQGQSFDRMAAAEAWGGTLTGRDRPEAKNSSYE